LAIEMSARIDEAVTIHERAMREDKDGEQKRLMRAEKILSDVDRDLQQSGGGHGFARAGRALPGVSDNSQKSTSDAHLTCEPADGPPVDHNDLNSLVFALEGLVKYRQYLLKKDEPPQAGGQDTLLSQAVAKFSDAYRLGNRDERFLLNWGNALVEMRKYDCAVEQFRRAGNIAPEDFAPTLNISVALLEKAAYTSKIDDAFDALRHLSDHLTWTSSGGGYGNIVAKVNAVLAKTGNDDDARKFAECVAEQSSYLPNPPQRVDAPNIDSLQKVAPETAALKLCIDGSRDLLATRVASPTLPR
jgi:tetratricopeptide (TPR) repeat protein